MTRPWLLARLLLVSSLALVVGVGPGRQTRAAIDPAVAAATWPASVQLGVILDVTRSSGVETVAIGMGSGTILSTDGLILTNYHVWDAPSAVIEQFKDEPNVKVRTDQLAVFLTKDQAQPPVPSFIAELGAEDPAHDLAVVRITRDVSGNPVDASSLGLRALELGDSDALNLGDELFIFGYPGIGGSTITYTSGSVAGFTPEQEISRGWIKTDATIAGGNSGGTGINREGKLVGIPTRAGAGAEDDPVVDCRPGLDTNGDGQLNEQDSCVPLGGFINALRPVNIAKPLIDQAASGVQSSSGPNNPGGNGNNGPAPEGTPGPQTTPQAQGTPQGTPGAQTGSFGPITFAAEADANNQPTNPTNTFPANTQTFSAFWDYQGMQNGIPWSVVWLLNGQKAIDQSLQWEGGPSGTYSYTVYGETGQPLPGGEYVVELSINGEKVQSATATVEGGGQGGNNAPPASGVRFTGQIVDAVSGQPIPGAAFAILKQGVTVADYDANPTDDKFHDLVVTDQNGVYSTSVPVERGKYYEILIGAQGYQRQQLTGEIPQDWPDQVEFKPFQLQPQQ